MDFLKSAPINQAIQLIQPYADHLTALYNKSSKHELYFLGAATFLTLYNLKSYIATKRRKLNLPPMVPFSLPLVGHQLYLLTIPNKFIDWCNKNYGEVYNIKTLGKIVTVTNGKSAEEVMKADSSDLSLEHGILRDLLHFHYVINQKTMELGFHVNPAVAKATLPNSKMPSYVPGIQRGLERAVHDLMNGDQPTQVKKPSVFFQNFVAYMSVPTLVGEEVATNPAVISSFAEFTGDIIGNVGIFMATPKFLHPLILPYLQSVSKHQKVMETHLEPVFKQRREKMQRAAEAGEDHGLEQNFLQGMMDYLHPNEEGVPVPLTETEMCHDTLLVAFAAVHTTSMNLSFSLYWLIARPDLMKRLLDEIDQVVPGNTPITAEHLAEMKFLNNFMREVLRQGVDRLANAKKAMHDYTFANGYQVPEGRIVQTNTRQLNFGNNQERATIDTMDPDMSHNKISSTPARDFVSFGMGKHLCPGRFFAIQEIQMALVHLLKHYEVKTASGKRPEPVTRIAGVVASNSEEPLIFTPRK